MTADVVPLGSPDNGGIWLQTCLAPLLPFLARDDVTDIHVNCAGEVWIETLSMPPYRELVPALGTEMLHRLARQIAAITSQGVSRAHPLLAGSLPTGERVQIALPPATRGEVALSLRKHLSDERSLDDYVVPLTERHDETTQSHWEHEASGDPASFLRRAVRDRRNVLVSGGTSSGKTTFLNALIREIPIDERLITIEDTPELKVPHTNAVGLIAVRGRLGEAAVSAEDLLIASLRMRPDRIILGEVRGSEAMTFLRAINTGHPGSLSTIHADTAEGAIDQLVMLALQAGSRMRWEDIDRYVRRTIDVIVQLERRHGARRIADVVVLK